MPHNYADDVTRFAYVYKYVTSHANAVHQLVPRCAELAELFDRPQVNITCIGGGPGSDFLGLLKYVIVTKKTLHLRLNLFDREPAWNECWSDVDEKLKSQLLISNVFSYFDVTDSDTWKPYKKYLSSNLFTMIYFMSEINSLREQAEPFFDNLLKEASPGALILYVDNNNKRFYGWFDTLIAKHNWKVLKSQQVQLTMGDTSEEKTDLGKYYEKFGYPKLTADIAFRVCQKQ